MQGSPFPSGIGPLPDFRGFQGMNDPRYPEVVKQGVVARRIADQVHVIAVTNNVVVQTGDDGVFLADNSFSMFFDQIMGTVRKISDKPIRIVTNSHSHGDHVQNNANLAKHGRACFCAPQYEKRPDATRAATGPAREQSARRGSSPPEEGGAVAVGQAPVPPAGWPTITSDAPMTFHFNGEDVMFVPLKAVAHRWRPGGVLHRNPTCGPSATLDQRLPVD